MTNLINDSKLLNFWGNKYIPCGIFRDKEVQITENFGTYRLEVETDLKGVFRTAFKSESFEEVKNYYLKTYGSCFCK